MTTPILRQTWTASAVLINMFGQGMVLSYPVSLLPGLNHPDSPIKTDLQSSSWLGSIVGAAGIAGFSISSVFMALYGRKVTHALAILPGIVGWLLIYFAGGIPMLMIGRFLCGMSSTATVSLGAIVIGEYTCPKYRGVLLYLKNASVCMGASLMHLISHHLHWRTIALVSLTPFFIALLIIFTWTESSAWLASKQRYDKSQEVFYWLRGHDEDSRREIEDILTAHKTMLSKPKIKSSYCDKIKNFFGKFRQESFLKPFVIMMLATIVLEMSGRHIFPAYALLITTNITGETSQSYYYTLGIDVTIAASAVFASVLVKIVNRRTLLFFSGFAALVVLTTVCLYLFLASKDIIPDKQPAIPIFLLLLYFILANLGCAPIPLALVGEVFPLAHRAVGSAMSGFWFSLVLWAGLKSTPHLIASIEVYGFFTVYGSIMAVCLLILYFIMPETKDRTLQEIENYFIFGKFTNDVDDDKEANIKMII